MKIVNAETAVVAPAAPAAADFHPQRGISLSELCATLGDICKDISRQEGVEGKSRWPGVAVAPGVCEVLPHLLLGSAAALRPGLLATLSVTCVINCATELPNTPVPENVAYLRVPLVDHPSAALHQHLDTVADAIEEVRLQGGRTLVHCVAGVSRSAALVLGYLVKHRAMPLADAFALVRAARPCVRPNSGFFRQLIDWEQRCLGVRSVSMVHHPALGAPIPDVYEADYRNTFQFISKYSRRS
ncbi:Dual specificity protein phosphatase 18 [Frankliniella fusca]|uniref:protein-serine/threonine phosphatase n=1 Tax=Frankliniella fusca TaxID=407009 RepID=A0AAE1LFR4_9NEOP|nr:Dual specificity protein phosphatase 18 [Frankliniella fusca]